ncbi:hypothetical protein [Serratia ureilytica]|uniref:hypothetical protein n=1 Tax=Serratia ureilytica TaxID=300181 RepID=UPI00371ADF0C
MKALPQRGERYRNVKGWTVFILGVKYRESVRVINPEFHCEVRFIYENSGHYTEMPISWFHEVYEKISGDGARYIRPKLQPIGRNFHNYAWLDDD